MGGFDKTSPWQSWPTENWSWSVALTLPTNLRSLKFEGRGIALYSTTEPSYCRKLEISYFRKLFDVTHIPPQMKELRILRIRSEHFDDPNESISIIRKLIRFALKQKLQVLSIRLPAKFSCSNNASDQNVRAQNKRLLAAVATRLQAFDGIYQATLLQAHSISKRPRLRSNLALR